jgi:c-di-GMP-binding flagellar brake protein YcgR
MIMEPTLQVHDTLQVISGDADAACLSESRVEDIAADELLISWPMCAGKGIPIRDQEVLTISFGRTQMAYAFEAIVVRRIEGPTAALAIRACSPLRSLQRRDNFRVRAVARVELTPKVLKLASFKQDGRASRHIRTETVNISAGGFTIHHGTPIPRGTIFDVALALPGEHRQPLITGARVVRCTPLEAAESAPPSFDLGFSYLRLSEGDRARLIRFVFSAEREEQREED